MKKQKAEEEKKEYFVPYKYLFGFIKIKDGWKDLGESPSFGKGEFKPTSFSGFGDTYTYQEELKYHRICYMDRTIYRLMMFNNDEKHIAYFWCPKCGRMQYPNYV